MPGWILDSVALIDWYCGRRGVRPYLTRILGGEERGGFSTISEVELWQDCVQAKRNDMRQSFRCENVFPSMALLPGELDSYEGSLDSIVCPFRMRQLRQALL